MTFSYLASAVAAILIVALPAAAQPATDGKSAYTQRCAGCHSENGWATRVLARRTPADQAALENRRALRAQFVTMIVRRGMGSMPQIRAAELDDATLAAIAAYLEGPK